MRPFIFGGMVILGVAFFHTSFAMGQAPASSVSTTASFTTASAASVSSTAVSSSSAGTVSPATAVTSAVSPSSVATRAQALALTSDDLVEGNMMAPLTIIEYGSLTCSHCADFSKDTYPQVKKDWVDSGRAKYVLRDMPWDNLALGMAKVARCAPENQRMALTKTFYAQQMKIITSKDPLLEIKSVARMAGLADSQVDACIKDPVLHSKVMNSKDTAFKILEVRGTPAFFINGTPVNGAVPYKDLKKILDAEYAKVRR